MAKWTMSEALAAELLAGLEQAARERAAGLAGETARQTAAYLGLGWLEEETGQALLGLAGLRAGAGALNHPVRQSSRAYCTGLSLRQEDRERSGAS